LEIYEFEEEDGIEESNHSFLKCNVGIDIFNSRRSQFEASTAETEATALHVALQITIDSELDQVIFKRDC